jgi:DNA polymerase III delta prime subunit
MNKNTLLINKYKPTRFCDFLEKEYDNTESINESASIIPFLKKQIDKNKILTLIVGEEETGKTTMLNTIISEYYGTSSTASYRSNVLHIHYLKEQGTSYYKNEVKYFCQTYCSIPGKKKTIVLDDLDFMTESNQTIFISIIDKYSKGVNFISSCKLLHKILYGIQTRLMIVRLHKYSVSNLLSIANKIITEEGIEFEPNAIDILMNVSKYKVNRMINCIDKIKLFYRNQLVNSDQPVTVNSEMVHQLCANIQYIIYKNYFLFILDNNLKSAIDVLYDLHDKGFSVIDILDNMFEYSKFIRNSEETNADTETDVVFLLPITETKVYEIIKVICKYITFFYNIHEDEIELALITNEIISTICI